MGLTRGELYRVRKPTGDPKKARVYVVVSRPEALDGPYSTAICAPVLSSRDGLLSQLDVGADEGLKHDSAIHCDGLVSVPKAALTDYVGSLSPLKLALLDDALRVALALD